MKYESQLVNGFREKNEPSQLTHSLPIIISNLHMKCESQRVNDIKLSLSLEIIYKDILFFKLSSAHFSYIIP